MKCFKPAALLQSTSGLLPQRGGLLLFPHTNKNQFTARLGLDLCKACVPEGVLPLPVQCIVFVRAALHLASVH